jgi:predicted glycoside hydrolase/deacetylase ChbG (UPF0249 family)
MLIITNADDFGYSTSTVEATIECFERGVLTSATIMVGMLATDQAVAYAKTHPNFSFGVHLNWCSDLEKPTASPSEIPSLLDPEDRLLPYRSLLLRGLLRRLSVDEIAKEAEGQIRWLQQAGIRVSHVDSHGHIHKFAPFRRALVQVLPQLGIRRVRSVQDVHLKRRWKSPTYWLGKRWSRGILQHFVSTEHFFVPVSGEHDQGWPDLLLSRSQGRTIEVGVHPGFEQDWRSMERRTIQQFVEKARTQGHRLIGWADLPA